MDQSQFSASWVMVGAFVIALVIRSLKADTRIPLTLPPAARPACALAFGVVEGVLTKLAAGFSWRDAMQMGLLAACTSIAGHEVVIEGMRRGREFIVPGLSLPPPPRRQTRSSPDFNLENLKQETIDE